MKKYNLSYVYVTIAAILWGSMGIFVRNLSAAGLVTMDIVFLRALVTSILLGIFLLIRSRTLLIIRPKDLWCFLGTGIVSIVLFNYCYFKTIQMTDMSTAAVLLYTAPVFVMLLSAVLFKEKLKLRSVLVLFMTFAGCVLVTGAAGSSSSLTTMGILTGLASGLGYALYSIFSRYALERGYHSLTITFYTFVTAAVFCIPMTNLKTIFAAASSGPDMILLILLLGIANTILPYFFYTKGLEKIENSTASMIATVEPLAAALFGAVLFGEVLTPSVIAGMALVIGGIAVLSL